MIRKLWLICFTVNLFPQPDVLSILKKAENLYKQKRFAEAIPLLESTRRKFPIIPYHDTIVELLAKSYEQNADYTKAIFLSIASNMSALLDNILFSLSKS